MPTAKILDWTDARVQLKTDEYEDVRYQVYRCDNAYFLDIQDSANEPLHTLELPEGMKLDKSSYEVLLRYVLLDVVAA